MIIAITGASGNMGEKVLKEIIKLDFVDEVHILAHREKTIKEIVKANKKYKNKITIISGSLSDPLTCAKLIEGTSYVINMAGVIPPLSDKSPRAAIEVNEIGVKRLVEAIENIKENQPKLIHTSTVAVYGYRNECHPFGRTGDPILPSPLDIYDITKMRGELFVLESNIQNYVVIRQSAMLYEKMMDKNVSDGLMFHTCFNTPLEWTTAGDSASLYRNIIVEDYNKKLEGKEFWNKCYNLGARRENRVTGFESLDAGFKLIGGSTFDFYLPKYNCTRNFHGMWFSDTDKLDELFHYKSETIEECWKKIFKKHWYYGFAKIVPKKLIKKFVIDKCLEDSNSPEYWYKHNDIPRIIANFGSLEEYESLGDDWSNFNLLCKGKLSGGTPINYDEFKKNETSINYYFDYLKDDKDITIEDLKKVAEAHAGKLITESYNGNIYEPLEWENQDKERFIMKPYSILRCGHWMNISYKEYAWDFDRLAKKDKIYASIWYDSHKKVEDHYYYFNESFEPKIK